MPAYPDLYHTISSSNLHSENIFILFEDGVLEEEDSSRSWEAEEGKN